MEDDLAAEYFQAVIGLRILNEYPFSVKLGSHFYDCHLLLHLAN
jgi:hypothetical protein